MTWWRFLLQGGIICQWTIDVAYMSHHGPHLSSPTLVLFSPTLLPSSTNHTSSSYTSAFPSPSLVPISNRPANSNQRHPTNTLRSQGPRDSSPSLRQPAR